MTYTRGDNLQAFDNEPITIELEDVDDDITITRALAVINNGVIVREYENPTFPITLELAESDTAKLSEQNFLRLIVYDDENRKLTCDGFLAFKTLKEVYNES